MLSIVQVIEFELGTGCNLGGLHAKCPNRHPERYAGLDTRRALDDETIVETATAAYKRFGFSGLVGWIYYNEPLLEMERMFSVMSRIRESCPFARFMLWSNGQLLPEQPDGRFAAFEQLFISQYDEAPDLTPKLAALHQIVGGRLRVLPHRQLDDRLQRLVPDDPEVACLRPYVELIVDAYGNIHLCCYDWRGEAFKANILVEDFEEVLSRWRQQLRYIAGHRMGEFAPEACRACGHRKTGHQCHDWAAIVRAEVWRATL